MNTEIPDSDNFKTRDAASYDSVTEQFDRFTEQISAPLADKMIELASIAPAENVLDVGTGTGVVALRAAKRLGAEGSVTAVDLSKKMLEAARNKAKHHGLLPKIDFRQMDAEALELPDAAFDVALSLFALLHFPDPLAAIKEIYRVVKPGGRFVAAVGGGPPLLSISGLAHRIKILPDIFQRSAGKQLVAPGFLDKLVQTRLPHSDRPAESHLASHSHNRTQGVASLTAAAGFVGIKTCWQGSQAEIATPEEFWEIQRTFSSIARKRLNDAAPEKAEALREEFLEKCRSVQSRGGTLVYPFAAFYAMARKPE